MTVSDTALAMSTTVAETRQPAEGIHYMGMFDTSGTASPMETRKENTLRKLERMRRTLRHEEPDREPISDFFWGGFTRRWRADLLR
jgi:hypothetical protein